MKTTDTLFRLVKSLNKNEKGYFKRHVNIHGASRDMKKYIMLFNAVDTLNVYDEIKIKRKFSKEKFVKQLHVTKNYLIKLILKSLRNYETSSVNSIITSIHDVEIFVAKGLFKQALAKLEKTKKAADDYGHYPLSLELLQIKKKIYMIMRSVDTIENLSGINREIEKTIRLYNNKRAYETIMEKTMALELKYGKVMPSGISDKYGEISTQPVMQNENNALSPTAKALYYGVKIAYCYRFNDIKNYYKHTVRYIDLLKANPKLYEEKKATYISALYSLGLALRMLKKYDDLRILLDEMRLFSEKHWTKLNVTDKCTFFQLQNSLTCYYWITTGNFKEAKSFVEKLLPEFKIVEKNISRDYLHFFFFFFSITYFGCGDYQEAIRYIYKILNEQRNAFVRQDLKIYSFILLLIIHYELRNYNISKYLLRSYKSLKFSGLQRTIIDFLALQLYHTSSEKEAMKLFQQFKSIILSHPDYTSSKEYFDFISWIDSKLQKKSFQEVTQKIQ
jgi:hypothetical protein